MANIDAIFLDASFLIAVVYESDRYHAAAMLINEHYMRKSQAFITSLQVLIEIGDFFSKPQLRHLGCQLIEGLLSDDEVSIIEPGLDQFRQAYELYRNRPGKEWGLTDCISFVIMRESKITKALTFDHHFEQAGFEPVQ